MESNGFGYPPFVFRDDNSLHVKNNIVFLATNQLCTVFCQYFIAEQTPKNRLRKIIAAPPNISCLASVVADSHISLPGTRPPSDPINCTIWNTALSYGHTDSTVFQAEQKYYPLQLRGMIYFIAIFPLFKSHPLTRNIKPNTLANSRLFTLSLESIRLSSSEGQYLLANPK